MALQAALENVMIQAPFGVTNSCMYIANQNAALLVHDQFQTLQLSHAPLKTRLHQCRKSLLSMYIATYLAEIPALMCNPSCTLISLEQNLCTIINSSTISQGSSCVTGGTNTIHSKGIHWPDDQSHYTGPTPIMMHIMTFCKPLRFIILLIAAVSVPS